MRTASDHVAEPLRAICHSCCRDRSGLFHWAPWVQCFSRSPIRHVLESRPARKMVRGFAEIVELVQKLGWPAILQENIRNEVEVRSTAGSVVLYGLNIVPVNGHLRAVVLAIISVESLERIYCRSPDKESFPAACPKLPRWPGLPKLHPTKSACRLMFHRARPPGSPPGAGCSWGTSYRRPR